MKSKIKRCTVVKLEIKKESNNRPHTINAYFEDLEPSCHVKHGLSFGNTSKTSVTMKRGEVARAQYCIYLEFTCGGRDGDVSAIQHQVLTETVYVTHQLHQRHAVRVGGRQSVILCPRQRLHTANRTQQFNRRIPQHYWSLSRPKILLLS